MNTTSVIHGFVVIVNDQVLSYADLRSHGYFPADAEQYYLEGSHGINGLLWRISLPQAARSLEGPQYTFAMVSTPLVTDGSLIAEPECNLFFNYRGMRPSMRVVALGRTDDNTLVAPVFSPGGMGQNASVKGKASIGVYTSKLQAPSLSPDEQSALAVAKPSVAPPPRAPVSPPPAPWEVPAPPLPYVPDTTFGMPVLSTPPSPVLTPEQKARELCKSMFPLF